MAAVGGCCRGLQWGVAVGGCALGGCMLSGAAVGGCCRGLQ